jgi:hypothetical protein
VQKIAKWTSLGSIDALEVAYPVVPLVNASIYGAFIRGIGSRLDFPLVHHRIASPLHQADY